MGYIPAKREIRPVIARGEGQCLREALEVTFPKGYVYNGLYIPLGRDASYFKECQEPPMDLFHYPGMV